MTAQASRWTAVTAAITAAEASGGTVGVALVAPDGATFAHHGDRPFHVGCWRHHLGRLLGRRCLTASSPIRIGR